MGNLNAEKIYKELAMFIDDMPTDLHLGFKRTVKFREFLKIALALITSQEQRIKELTAKVAKWEEECDLRGDMWCKLNEENKRLTEENERLRADKDYWKNRAKESDSEYDQALERILAGQ